MYMSGWTEMSCGEGIHREQMDCFLVLYLCSLSAHGERCNQYCQFNTKGCGLAMSFNRDCVKIFLKSKTQRCPLCFPVYPLLLVLRGRIKYVQALGLSLRELKIRAISDLHM